MNSKIEMLPSYKIAYMRKTGPYGSSNGELMEQLKSWVQSNNLFNEDTIILGIAQDNPETTNAESCCYDACLVVADNYKIVHPEIIEGNIVGGKYMVFKLGHTAQAVQQAWANIFPELIKQGYTIDDTRPIIERYQTQVIKDHQCEICVPIY